jgi:hypothetical protein
VLDARRTTNDSAVANCPAQADLDGKKWAESVGGTAYHAEGGALLRSAEASGFGPGTAPSRTAIGPPPPALPDGR